MPAYAPAVALRAAAVAAELGAPAVVTAEAVQLDVLAVEAQLAAAVAPEEERAASPVPVAPVVEPAVLVAEVVLAAIAVAEVWAFELVAPSEPDVPAALAVLSGWDEQQVSVASVEAAPAFAPEQLQVDGLAAPV